MRWDPAGRVGSRRVWGHAAAAWAWLFAALHLCWAVGGSQGLAASAGTRLAQERPVWFVASGLYGVAFLLAAAGAVGLLVARGGEGYRQQRLLVLLAAGISAVLLLRAIGLEVVLLADSGYGHGAVSPAERTWTLLLWNPWFLAGGVVFGGMALAARRGSRPVRSRR